MTLRIGTALRNAMASAVNTTLSAGAGAPVVRIYTGSQPATPATAATGTLLVEIPLNDPAGGSPATGVITVDVDPEPTADASNTGTAGWFRILDSDGVAHIDGAIGAEMTLASTSITSGTAVTITGGTITQPAA
jgi:hypothetical protein